MDSSNKNHKKVHRARLSTVILVTLALLLLLIVLWYLVLPALGISIIVTGNTWNVVVGTIFALAVIGLLFFIITGVWIFILGLLALMWVVFAITIFPFLFPLFIPVLVVVLFIGYMRRRQQGNR